MSDIIGHGRGPYGSNEKDRREAEQPVDKRPRMIRELDQKIEDLRGGTIRQFEIVQADADILLDIVNAMAVIQGALLKAVQALAADPHNPVTGAADARTAIDTAMEEAYGPAEGHKVGPVVPETEGTSPGDS